VADLKKLVMPGLAAFAEASAAERDCGPAKPWRRRVPGIHGFLTRPHKDVDGGDKPGHDEQY
jgi:hypothetical protein